MANHSIVYIFVTVNQQSMDTLIVHLPRHLMAMIV